MAGLNDFAGRVAVVTGGASGIGRGIAEVLIAAGARVVIADIEQAALDSAALQIGAIGIQTDVSKADSVLALANAVIERFGQVDILCNNAGVGSMAKIEAMTLDDWQWMLGVNLWGVVHGLNAFLPHLIANQAGAHVVNTASIGGFAPLPSLGSYAVSKFGIVALTEVLALEMAADHPHVGATVLAPGPIRSNIGKSRRNRPADFDGGSLADIELDDVASDFGGAIPWAEPRRAGEVVIDAIRNGSLYATTHPEWFGVIAQRHEAIAAAMGQ